jgi:hypothetical protein
MQFLPNTYGGMGLIPQALKSRVWNRTGATLTVGEVVMTDTLALDAEDGQVAGDLGTISGVSSVTTNPGADSFPLNNVITPTTAGIGGLGTTAIDVGYWFGLVLDLGDVGTGVDNSVVTVLWQGRGKAKMAATVATAQYGKSLVAANSVRTLTLTTAAGVKIIARLEQDTTTQDVNADVLFDGINGFGNGAAS